MLYIETTICITFGETFCFLEVVGESLSDVPSDCRLRRCEGGIEIFSLFDIFNSFFNASIFVSFLFTSAVFGLDSVSSLSSKYV